MKKRQLRNLIPRAPDGISETVLADDAGYMIVYLAQPKAADRIVVTFDTISDAKQARGFGVEFLLKRGFDVIHVSQRIYSSYQDLSLEDFKKAVSPYIGKTSVFTYGSSLGGYAALYYAGIIGARAISLSPRCPAHPDIKARVKSYQGFTTPFRHLEFLDPGFPRPALPPVIAFDPLEGIDNAYYEARIRDAFPNAEMLLLENGMHSVAPSLQASGALKDLVLTVINEGRVPPIDFDPMKDPRYTGIMAVRKCQEGDIDACMVHLQAALDHGGHYSCFDVIKTLVEKRALAFYPDHLEVLDPLRLRIVARKYAGPLAAAGNTPEQYVLLARMNMHLMSYQAAYDIVHMARLLFPDDPGLKKEVTCFKRILHYVNEVKARKGGA